MHSDKFQLHDLVFIPQGEIATACFSLFCNVLFNSCLNVGDNDMWDPVWTQRRGVIEGSGKMGTESEFYNAHIHTTEIVQEEEGEGDDEYDEEEEDAEEYGEYGEGSGDVDIPVRTDSPVLPISPIFVYIN